MNGIEKITERIEQDMGAEIAALEAEARQRVDEIIARYEAIAARESEEILARGRTDAAEREKRLLGLAELETRKLQLAAKQELISQAFEQAAHQLTKLPEDEYVELLAQLAARAAQSGREEIALSPQDRERLGERVIAAANARLEGAGFSLSATTHDASGGLLLLDGNIKINCTFESMIRLLRESAVSEVAAALFETALKE